MQLSELWALSEKWLGRSHLVVWLVDVVTSAISGIIAGHAGQIAGWQWIWVIFIVIGVAFVAFILISIVILGLSWFFVARLIPLRKVARRAYEQSQGLAIGNRAETEANTPDAILDFFANVLIAATAVYAKRLPSTKFTRLNPEDTQGLKSTNGAKNLFEVRSKVITHGALCIRREDIKVALGFVEHLNRPI